MGANGFKAKLKGFSRRVGPGIEMRRGNGNVPASYWGGDSSSKSISTVQSMLPKLALKRSCVPLARSSETPHVSAATRSSAMPSFRSPIFEDVSRLMSDAVGVAQGARREAETLAKSQIERVLSKMNVVTREEFEAVRDMATLAREENERLEKRIAELESKLTK